MHPVLLLASAPIPTIPTVAVALPVLWLCLYLALQFWTMWITAGRPTLASLVWSLDPTSMHRRNRITRHQIAEIEYRRRR